MTWTSIAAADHAAGKPVVGAGGWGEQVVGNLDYLFGLLGTIEAGDIPNGSFEIDSDANGVPDNWTRSLYPGGTGARDILIPQHGAACIKLTHPGGASNGGGEFESDYVACSPTVPEILGLIHWATAAGMHNKIQVKFFTAAKLTISTTDLYDSTANPTIPTQFLLGFTPPATARFYKFILIGGDIDVDAVGSAYFDGVTRQPLLTLANMTNGSVAASSNSLTWVDAATLTLTFPTSHNLPLRLLVPALISGGDDGLGSPTIGTVRLKCGANYSHEATVGGVVLASAALNVTAPAGTFATAHGARTLDIIIQLKTSNVAGSAECNIAANSVQGSY